MPKQLLLPPDLLSQLGSDPFADMMALRGIVFRDVPGRRTMRVMLNGQAYFIKQHTGTGWAYIMKSLLSLKRPIVSALTEVTAIQTLNQLGIATTPLVAYGEQGCNPATRQSFILTRDLGDIHSLEDFYVDWCQQLPSDTLKRRLIRAVAELARQIHGNGFNHRDFYLCHLCLTRAELAQARPQLTLIDLHRSLVHGKPQRQLNIKDLAALYFSSYDLQFSDKDLALFAHFYGQHDAAFWQQVQKRAKQLYQRFHSRKFQQRVQQEREVIGSDARGQD